MNNEKKDNCSKYSLVVRIYVSEWLGTQDMVFSTLKKRVNNVLIFFIPLGTTQKFLGTFCFLFFYFPLLQV